MRSAAGSTSRTAWPSPRRSRRYSGSTPRPAPGAWPTWAALGVGDPSRDSTWNADAAIEAVAGLAGRLGMPRRVTDLGISRADFDQIAADALDDEVLANTPRPPDAADIQAILLASEECGGWEHALGTGDDGR